MRKLYDRSHRTLLRRLSRQLVPGFVRRFDAYLLLNRPVVWRTRVHYMVVLSLILANALLLFLGFLYPISRQNAPTIGDVANLVTMLQLLGGAGLLYWGYLQYRQPMGVWRIRKYLLTWILYSSCIFSVIINPLSFTLPLVHRIAAVIPKDSFAADYAFHQSYGFWCCYQDLTEDLAETHRARIQHDLKKYGLGSEFTFNEDSRSFWWGKVCMPDAPCLDFSTPDSNPAPTLFGDRLKSIKAAQELATNRSGVYFVSYSGRIDENFYLSLILAGALLAATLPKHVWRRTFEQYGVHLSLPDIRLPRPPFLSRLDQRLLISHPLVWSTRAHSLLLNSIIYGTIVFGLAGLVIREFTNLDERLNDIPEPVLRIMGLFGIMLFGALPASIWAYEQCTSAISTSTISNSQFEIILYFVATLPSSIIGFYIVYYMIMNNELGGSDDLLSRDIMIASYMFVFLGTCFLIGLVFVRKRGTFGETALAVFASLPLLLVFLVMMHLFDDKLVISSLMIIPWLATGAVLVTANIRKRSTRVLATLARIYIAAVPTILMSLLVLLAEFPPSDDWVAAVPLLCAIPTYVVLGIPAIRMLANYTYQPKYE